MNTPNVQSPMQRKSPMQAQTPFIRTATTAVTIAQATSFHALMAGFTAAKNPYKSTGARTLAKYAPFLRQYAPSHSDAQIAASLKAMDNSPVAHLSDVTVVQYVIAARNEFGIRKYRTARNASF